MLLWRMCWLWDVLEQSLSLEDCCLTKRLPSEGSKKTCLA